ncbi:LOW QUALITY PROTEIN: hypothetical protein CsSME_00048179 [Camellia sinensis var. sinensis]
MNQLVARAVLRRMIGGGRSCNRYLSTPPSAVAVVVTPLDEAVVLWRSHAGDSMAAVHSGGGI